jgi:chorismate synthase
MMQIRQLQTHEEYAACVALQTATWGEGFRELVPATILKITQRLGGVAAGAFEDDGTLVGFVFGMTGVERGEIVHWSDMLAVRADAQNRGVGRRLKEFQREAIRAVGATRMYWTYDPLVARNAHFNLERLRASVAEYVPDMYGSDTGSMLHDALGTDRFVVTWILPDAPAPRRGDLPHPDRLPVLNAGTESGHDSDPNEFAGTLPPVAAVEIPRDIFALQAASPQLAMRWRETTRRAFQWALANGYRVVGFSSGESEKGRYILRHEAATQA